jgi:hypothetical protein
MRVQRRDGGPVHHGTRERAKGGYRLRCTKSLVPYSAYKRTKRAINCEKCQEAT